MTAAIDLPKLYRRAINLWVEDALTSEYLKDIWRVPDLLCLISGTSDSIGPAVTDARRNGVSNVFGVVDRDFYETNYQKWGRSELRYFVLPVHEIENYLLDPAALAGCDANTNNRTVADIDARMRAKAKDLVWWMACRHTIKRLRKLCWDNFMPVPKVSEVTDLQSACDHITSTDWFNALPVHAGQMTDSTQVETWVNGQWIAYSADLAMDEWRRSFAGKELFRHARGDIYQPPQVATSLTYDIDVAKSVASWQVANGQVPTELSELLNAIQAKA